MSNRLTVWWTAALPAPSILPLRRNSVRHDTAWLAEPRAPALSFSLPKQAESFQCRDCQPFFGGILPEQSQRTAIARALGVWPIMNSGCLSILAVKWQAL